MLSLSYIFSYTGSSYRYGYSARSFALSNALVAGEYNLFQSFSNPASLNQCKGSNYGLSYFDISLDRSIQSFYFSQSLPGNAGISLAILRSGVDEFMGKDFFNNPTDNISASDYYGLLSFGLKSFGMTLKLHYSNLHLNQEHVDNYTGNSIIVDLGWAANISSNIRLGIKAENLINPFLNWDIDTGDGLPTSYQETYPLIISIGSIYKINDIHQLMFQEDISFFNRDSESINFDNNYSYLTRIGYEYSPSNNFDFRLGLEGKNNIKFGFGYHITLYIKLPLSLDYSLDLGSENQGLSHLFTWGFNL